MKYSIKYQEKTEIIIADNAINKLGEILKNQSCSGFVVLSDTTTQKLFGKTVELLLKKLNKPVLTFTIEEGEQNKSLVTIEKLISFLTMKNCDRKTAIVGVGGGVVCDMATFAAGIFFRGLYCIQIPTTLLAQVDASIGGKGGVNIGQYKNLLGVIKQPDVIVIDPKTLAKLPKDQITSGMAEVIKMAIAFDKPFFEYLYKIKSINSSVLKKAIQKAVALKMKIIKADPKEATNTRTALNFGHSLGHAIELMAGIPHGFAVAIGMVYAMEVSKKVTGFSENDMEKAVALLKKYDLPTTVKNLSQQKVLEHMKKDKKNFGGNFRMVLLKSIGKLEVVENIDKKIIEDSFKKVLL